MFTHAKQWWIRSTPLTPCTAAPHDVAFMYRGMIHLRMNDYDAAASDINAALQLKPGMSQLLTAKAVCRIGPLPCPSCA